MKNTICWCGNTDLVAFSNEYSECRVCGTLVSLVGLSPEKLVVQDDEQDFYGKQYWLDHQQEDLGFPNIFQRARNDLTERNLHWLKTVMKYRLPAANVLELGCSHGSFVALLKLAGYQATGLEMSSWVAEFGRETFGVPLLVGPIEIQNLESASLDVIAMMDVLEHFPDPLATMRCCLKLLKPDGVLLIQTPQFREGVGHGSLVAGNHRFLEQLKSDEHLYLFSERSVTEFFKRLGVGFVSFEPAIFDCYDMFLAVSHQPMKTHTPEKIEQILLSSPNGRMVQALLDLRARELSLIQQLHESELDRAARWEQIQTLTAMVKKRSFPKFRANTSSPKESRQLRTIAVDLTPVLPGGHNGGAKVFVLELIRHLAVLAPEIRFILLTHSASHDELAQLDAPNISRHKVIDAEAGCSSEGGLPSVLKPALSRIPGRFRVRIHHLLHRYYKRRADRNVVPSLQADLLFCPFTAPTYHAPGIPTVCTFYDIQYKTYPQFFEPADVMQRDYTFRDACRRATVLAAISDYSRDSAIKEGGIPPGRIRTIYLRMAQRFNASPEGAGETLLSALGLEQGQYLVYPANFWKHKNHEMLLEAFLLARTQGLSDRIKLVCTGAPGERQQWLATAIGSMGLAEHTVLPGYISDEELAVLLKGSRGMIFPSLYEGFGLPVIEAMAAGIPVACSNVTSLPEVASGAALLFDPRIPEQIAAAIHALVSNEDARARCIQAGIRRAAEFSDARQMALEYLDAFNYAHIQRHPEVKN